MEPRVRGKPKPNKFSCKQVRTGFRDTININNYIHPANEKEISTEELLDTHRKSATFRSGKISTWKESVPKNLVAEIQEALAPSVALLGYTN